jgi:hypothetical protein
MVIPMGDTGELGAAVLLTTLLGAAVYGLVYAFAPEHLLPAMGFVGLLGVGFVLMAWGDDDD